MNDEHGLGDREGVELLAHVARYVPSLRAKAAAGLLGAMTDDPAAFGDLFEGFVADDPPPPTVR